MTDDPPFSVRSILSHGQVKCHTDMDDLWGNWERVCHNESFWMSWLGRAVKVSPGDNSDFPVGLMATGAMSMGFAVLECGE